MESDSQKPHVIPIKKAATDDLSKKDDLAKNGKLKDAKMKKPELMSSKPSIEVSPKRPRGRPPVNRDFDPIGSPPRKSSEPEKQVSYISQSTTPQNAVTSTKQSVASIFKLPTLKMDKCKVYNFTMQKERVTIGINNNLVASKLHEVKCTSQKYNWTALLSSHVVTVGASQGLIVILCRNGTLHYFRPSDRGQRLFPPIQLPSAASKICIENNHMALVTTCGHLYLWTLDPRPKIKMGKENIQTLFTNGITDEVTSSVSKIVINPEIILITSAGRSFTYDESLGSWLCLTDTSSSIQSCSSYATAAANLPPETASLPLASLGYLTPNQLPRLQNTIPDETKALATVTHCRNQRLAAEYLNSPKEYQYWLLAEVKQMAASMDTEGIRTTFDWLMGPVHSSSAQETAFGGLKKRYLLRAALDSIKGNLNLQRLYIEYHDQLNSANEVGDIDKLLHV